MLFIIGALKCFDCLIKRFITKNQNKVNQFNVKLFNINFILTVYADNIKADIDNSKVLSSKEAVLLALTLSLDGLAAGFGYGLAEIHIYELVTLSLASNILAILLGYIAGKTLTKITSMDLSWLGGVILIILAIWKLPL